MVSVISTLILDVSHAVEVLPGSVYVCWWCKMPYICCIFNTAVVVVACVLFIPGFSPCRGYWVSVFCCLFVVCIYVRLIMSS